LFPNNFNITSDEQNNKLILLVNLSNRY
jgi:hypothetical protein